MNVLLTGVNIIGPIGSLVVTFIVLGFTTVILLYWYSSRKHDYWKNLGIPYLKPAPFFGSVISNALKPLQDLELERYNKLGRVYGHYEGNRAVISVAEPEILRRILVKDFQAFTGRRFSETGDKIMDSFISHIRGEDWKRVRNIVTSTFSTGKIKRMIAIFKDCSRTLVKNLKIAAEKGECVEAKTIYGAFTMDSIASSAFSTKIDSHNDPNNEFVRAAKSAFLNNNKQKNFNWRMILFFLINGWLKLLRINILASNEINFFVNATNQIIEERKRTGQTRNDFLQLLLDTYEESQDEGELGLKEKENDVLENYAIEENKVVFKSVTRKTLSFNEVVAQCVIFFLAGYDTIALTLSFATHSLALNPDIQDKLIKELDDALRESNGELTYETVQGLKSLDNVISETLRLYSPSIRSERVADEDYKLGDTGITIPKGMIVTVPLYAMHRDPEHFPDPEKFDPDRFTPEERAKRHQYAYMPFGMGPRSCVAMRFALMEIKVCLAHVLRNFRIKRCSKTKDRLEFDLGLGDLLQPKDINVKFEVRKDTFKAL